VSTSSPTSSCPLCSGTTFELVFHHTNKLFGGNYFAGLYRCPCGLLLTLPHPTDAEMTLLYEAAPYYTHSTEANRMRRLVAQLQLRFPFRQMRLFAEEQFDFRRHLLRLAPRHFTLRRGMRLLDFGCGSGRLAASVAGLGLDVIGVEPDAEARRAAQSRDSLGRRSTPVARAFGATAANPGTPDRWCEQAQLDSCQA
jgi:hypothetical protein